MNFELGKVYSNPYARAFKSHQMMEDERDHEVGMAQGQLDYVIKSATELKGKLGSAEKNIPGWIQDHISKAHSYLHQANSGYHELDDKISVNNYKLKESVNESKHPHLKTNVKTDSDYSKVASILKSNKINYAWSAESGTLIFRDRFDMMKAEDLLGKKWLKENVNEATPLQKIFRKIGWGGDSWTPKDYARQIKNLSDRTLKIWYDSAKKNKGIPNTPLAFQQKLTKIEMEKRGLIETMKLKEIGNIKEMSPTFNKWLLKFVDSYITGGEFTKGSPQFQWALSTLLSATLTDANFHKEAKKAKNIFRRAEEPNNADNIEKLLNNKASEITKKAKWDGYDIIDGFAYVAAMRIGGPVMQNVTALKNESVKLKESTEEPKIITQLRDVMKSGYKKLKCPKTGRTMTVDSYSASAIVKVYDALKDPKNKEKFSSAGLLGMQSMAFKLMR